MTSTIYRNMCGHYARGFMNNMQSRENFNDMYKEAIKEAKADAWAEGFNYGMFPDARWTYEDLLARNPYLPKPNNTQDVTDFMECSG